MKGWEAVVLDDVEPRAFAVGNDPDTGTLRHGRWGREEHRGCQQGEKAPGYGPGCVGTTRTHGSLGEGERLGRETAAGGTQPLFADQTKWLAEGDVSRCRAVGP